MNKVWTSEDIQKLEDAVKNIDELFDKLNEKEYSAFSKKIEGYWNWRSVHGEVKTDTMTYPFMPPLQKVAKFAKGINTSEIIWDGMTPKEQALFLKLALNDLLKVPAGTARMPKLNASEIRVLGNLKKYNLFIAPPTHPRIIIFNNEGTRMIKYLKERNFIK